MPLDKHGLRWLHHEAPLAHPLDDGTAVTLERGLDETVEALGADGKAWRTLVEPLVEGWDALAPELSGPLRGVRGPARAGFGAAAVPP